MVQKKTKSAKKPATKAKPQKRKSSRRTKRSSSGKHTLLKFLLVCGLIVFLALAGYVFYCYATLPDIQKAVSATRQPSTVIMAENGNDIAKFGNVYAQVIYPDKLPKNLTDAVVATEDRRFYDHFGVDILGVMRAIAANLFSKRYAQGASTITQQVAKNIFLTPNKNIKRKVQELLLAFWLEDKLTKNQIMALYLNRVYFGAGNYGADAAAGWYFNKSVYDLNLREAAILAGMLKAPNRYNPVLHREESLKRASVVLDGMRKCGFISEEMYRRALKMPVSNGQQYRVEGGKHFASYIYNEVNALLGERNADITVMTTLDQTLQEKTEKILRHAIYSAKGQNVTEGAAVVLDYDGAIKAMAGGIDYGRSQFNRAVQARRQAGSAFKPFVYITALQLGFTPSNTIEDAPVTVGKWSPENYTKRYYGKVTLTYALAHSLNAATVALSKELYLKDIAANAHKMGITTDIKLTPSMVLGTNGVRVIDMAAAYAVMANGGYAVHPYGINEIDTADGRQIYVRKESRKESVLDPKTAKGITYMLEQVIKDGTGRRAKLPVPAAGKTGTSQNYRDAWFIGWAGGYVAAVWVGNDNEKPMNKVGGGTLPAEIWRDIMSAALENGGAYDTSNDAIGSLIESGDADEPDDAPDDDAIGGLIEDSGGKTPEKSAPQSMEDLLDSI